MCGAGVAGLALAARAWRPRYWPAAVAGAELISAVLRITDNAEGTPWRLRVMLERVAVAAATIVVYDGVRAITDHRETVPAVLLALGAAAIAQVPVDLAARWAR